MMYRLRGMSLIEVLVAVGIVGLLGVMLAQSLSSSMTAKEETSILTDRYAAMRVAMSRMTQELSMGYLSKHVSIVEPRAKTRFKGTAERIDMTAWGYIPRVEDNKQSDVRQLSFFIDDDRASQTRSLMRREQNHVDLNIEKGGRIQPLLTDVVSLKFGYWNNDKREWLEAWDTDAEQAGRLPSRIRITLVAKRADGSEETLYTQSQIPITTAISL